MVSVALIALVIGITVNPVRRAWKQGSIITRIRSLGGDTLYDFEYGFSPERGGPPGWEPPAAPHPLLYGEWSADFLADVVYVQLSARTLTDESLQDLDLQRLRRMHHLNLCDTQVSDASIPCLAKLTQLRTLDLPGTRVTDKGITQLRKRLPNCTIRTVKGPP